MRSYCLTRMERQYMQGLLNEAEFKKATGYWEIKKYREKGLIKPIGYAMTLGSRVSAMYHPRQIRELKNKLGITLEETTGLLNETEFISSSGFTQIAKYREKGIIVPFGYALSNAGISPFYDPRQIKELKAKLQKIAESKSKP